MAVSSIPLSALGAILALTVFWAVPIMSGAETAATKMTRESAIRTALAGNRELGVAALEIDRAKLRLHWSGRLDNPELELSGAFDQFGSNEGEAGFEIAFSQRFPVTSRLRKEKEVRRRDVTLAEIELQSRQRQLAYEVDKAWIEWRAARQSEALQKKLFEVNESISAFLAERAKLGEVSSLDATQASLNGKLLKQEVGLATAAVASATARLRKLCGIEPGSALTLVDDFSFPKSVPSTALDLSVVLRQRPDYAMLLAAGDLGEAQLQLAMAQRWDDIALKVFVEGDKSLDEPVGLDRSTFTGIGISIPLPLRNRNQQAIEEAKIDIEKARRARGAKAFAVRSEMQKALEERKAAYELASDARGESLPLAQKNLEEFQKAQQDGQASVLQVQQAQSQLLQLETAAQSLRKNYDFLDAKVRFIGGSYPFPDKTTSGASK